MLQRRKRKHTLSVIEVVAKGRSRFSGLVVYCHPCLGKPLKLSFQRVL